MITAILCSAVAQFQKPRHIEWKWVHYWTQIRTKDLVLRLYLAQTHMICATYLVKTGTA